MSVKKFVHKFVVVQHIELLLCAARWRHYKILNMQMRTNLGFLNLHKRQFRLPTKVKFGTKKQTTASD